tara:strand:- start:359 stop:511 length:153 start_codon:yes stop_codon:yes gene_type:complete
VCSQETEIAFKIERWLEKEDGIFGAFTNYQKSLIAKLAEWIPDRYPVLRP